MRADRREHASAANFDNPAAFACGRATRACTVSKFSDREQRHGAMASSCYHDPAVRAGVQVFNHDRDAAFRLLERRGIMEIAVCAKPPRKKPAARAPTASRSVLCRPHAPTECRRAITGIPAPGAGTEAFVPSSLDRRGDAGSSGRSRGATEICGSLTGVCRLIGLAMRSAVRRRHRRVACSFADFEPASRTRTVSSSRQARTIPFAEHVEDRAHERLRSSRLRFRPPYAHASAACTACRSSTSPRRRRSACPATDVAPRRDGLRPAVTARSFVGPRTHGAACTSSRSCR